MRPPGPLEIGLVLVIILIVFGAGKLPQVFSALGQGIGSFRKSAKGENPDEQDDKEAEKKPKRKTKKAAKKTVKAKSKTVADTAEIQSKPAAAAEAAPAAEATPAAETAKPEAEKTTTET